MGRGWRDGRGRRAEREWRRGWWWWYEAVNVEFGFCELLAVKLGWGLHSGGRALRITWV